MPTDIMRQLAMIFTAFKLAMSLENSYDYGLRILNSF